jgi:hypothetical protein
LINDEKMKGKLMTYLVRYGAFENIGLSSKSLQRLTHPTPEKKPGFSDKSMLS